MKKIIALAVVLCLSLVACGGRPMKTGWQSVKLALVGFIVPFMYPGTARRLFSAESPL